jgi:hypothetical protein
VFSDAVQLTERYAEPRHSRTLKTVLRRLWLCLWALWALIWLFLIRDYGFKAVGFVVVWPLVLWGIFNLLVLHYVGYAQRSRDRKRPSSSNPKRCCVRRMIETRPASWRRSLHCVHSNFKIARVSRMRAPKISGQRPSPDHSRVRGNQLARLWVDYFERMALQSLQLCLCCG